MGISDPVARRVLVTGGAGFLGSHLCERLVEAGHEVLCLDNTGRRANVAHLLDHPNFELIRHDVTFPLYVEVDEIYNLACPASPVHYQHDPVQTTKVSVHGAINMLGLAKRLGVKILQASTSEVYGDPLVHPQTEDYRGNVNPIGPRACYDEGKRCAETLFFDYHRQHGVSIRVARIFNTYGPRMHPEDGRVVSNFIIQALTGEPITLYGDGSQTRAFCFVDDQIDGLMRLMNAPDTVIGPVNIGNPHEITILQLAQAILKITGSTSEIVFRPLPQDDPLQRCPDIARARDLLGWEPVVALEQGLERREVLAAPAPRDVVRHQLEEGGELAHDERQDQHEHEDEQHDEGEQDDECRPQPPEPELLEPVRHRVEQVGERQRRHERQQDAGEQPQEEGRRHQGREPEPDLLLDAHRPRPAPRADAPADAARTGLRPGAAGGKTVGGRARADGAGRRPAGPHCVRGPHGWVTPLMAIPAASVSWPRTPSASVTMPTRRSSRSTTRMRRTCRSPMF